MALSEKPVIMICASHCGVNILGLIKKLNLGYRRGGRGSKKARAEMPVSAAARR
jgi:hypothetical protein